MRLSEDRIQSIARKIIKDLAAAKLIQLKGFSARLETEIGRVVIQDLMIEDEIDKEVERQIETMKRDIPYGSAEWKAVFTQIKDKLSEQRKYIAS